MAKSVPVVNESQVFPNESEWYDYNIGNFSDDICYTTTVSQHLDFTQIDAVLYSLTAVYILIIILSVWGNIMVIWTVWKNTHMHTVTNYYIVNLAVSDLLVTGVVMPLKLLEYTSPCHWHIFQSIGPCFLVYYMLPIFVFASVLTLVAISMER